jgi:uncharacterized protein (DUF1501 family)
MDRRKFVIQSSLFTASNLLTVGVAQSANSNQKRLIVIFLRGAVDGLSAVVPYFEKAYYENRPKIAIPKPGEEGGVLDLDGRFGLHPSLLPLMSQWKQGNLAFIHSSGSPDTTRSHFDAQDYMESGTPGIKRTSDGWMNRLLGQLSQRNPIQAVTIGAATPRILSGRIPVANIASGKAGSNPLPIHRPQVSNAFDKLYNSNDTLSQTYKEGRQARQAIITGLNMSFDEEMKMANNGASLPNGFPKDAQMLAKLMLKDPRVQLGFMAVGGWDTHINQGSSKGQLAQRLGLLGQGLGALVENLREVYKDTTILVISEFGRTVKENGNGGTDHGHGNVMWVLGGKIRGGKVYGKWSGLENNQLFEGRDLAVTTDFRDVIVSLLQGHMRLSDNNLNKVFPGYQVRENIKLV